MDRRNYQARHTEQGKNENRNDYSNSPRAKISALEKERLLFSVIVNSTKYCRERRENAGNNDNHNEGATSSDNGKSSTKRLNHHGGPNHTSTYNSIKGKNKRIDGKHNQSKMAEGKTVANKNSGGEGVHSRQIQRQAMKTGNSRNNPMQEQDYDPNTNERESGSVIATPVAIFDPLMCMSDSDEDSDKDVRIGYPCYTPKTQTYTKKGANDVRIDRAGNITGNLLSRSTKHVHAQKGSEREMIEGLSHAYVGLSDSDDSDTDYTHAASNDGNYDNSTSPAKDSRSQRQSSAIRIGDKPAFASSRMYNYSAGVGGRGHDVYSAMGGGLEDLDDYENESDARFMREMGEGLISMLHRDGVKGEMLQSLTQLGLGGDGLGVDLSLGASSSKDDHEDHRGNDGDDADDGDDKYGFKAKVEVNDRDSGSIENDSKENAGDRMTGDVVGGVNVHVFMNREGKTTEGYGTIHNGNEHKGKAGHVNISVMDIKALGSDDDDIYGNPFEEKNDYDNDTNEILNATQNVLFNRKNGDNDDDEDDEVNQLLISLRVSGKGSKTLSSIQRSRLQAAMHRTGMTSLTLAELWMAFHPVNSSETLDEDDFQACVLRLLPSMASKSVLPTSSQSSVSFSTLVSSESLNVPSLVSSVSSIRHDPSQHDVPVSVFFLILLFDLLSRKNNDHSSHSDTIKDKKREVSFDEMLIALGLFCDCGSVEENGKDNANDSDCDVGSIGNGGDQSHNGQQEAAQDRNAKTGFIFQMLDTEGRGILHKDRILTLIHIFNIVKATLLDIGRQLGDTRSKVAMKMGRNIGTKTGSPGAETELFPSCGEKLALPSRGEASYERLVVHVSDAAWRASTCMYAASSDELGLENNAFSTVARAVSLQDLLQWPSSPVSIREAIFPRAGSRREER